MELFNQLPAEDVGLLHQYLSWYGGACDDGYCSDDSSATIPLEKMSYFLRYWSEEKAPFYRMFGNKFIIKKEISFETTKDELYAGIENNIIYTSDWAIRNFKHSYEMATRHRMTGEYYNWALNNFIYTYDWLVDNIYDGDTFTIPREFTVDGHPLVVNHGCKTVKMLGKIVKALGCDVKAKRCPECGTTHPVTMEVCPACQTTLEETTGYEEYRKAHSLVLNQKRVKGNLCLSIHPLDFLTMSDNDCGWSSCMSWVEEPGDYRLGTIEMMNSPYVVIAYVEASNPMTLCNSEWNNKRWRQLCVVTPDLILGNKQYPYVNEDIQGAALKWLRELASAHGGYGPYSAEAVNINNKSHNTIGTHNFYVNLSFSYMYNDIYDLRMGYLKEGFAEKEIRMNLSGHAVCTSCGSIIHYDDVEANWTVCPSCSPYSRCDMCGDRIYGRDGEYYLGDRDEPVCSYCYHNEAVNCDVCGDRVGHTVDIFIRPLEKKVPEDLEYANWDYAVHACEYCASPSRGFVRTFGDLKLVPNRWGMMRRTVSLDSIEESGLRYSELSSEEIDVLYKIKSVPDGQERIDLMRELGF
jgi:hypothetical protein